MTKKDFQLIADVIAQAWHASADSRADLAHAMADKLEDTNPRFNRELFIKACGVTL